MKNAKKPGLTEAMRMLLERAASPGLFTCSDVELRRLKDAGFIQNIGGHVHNLTPRGQAALAAPRVTQKEYDLLGEQGKPSDESIGKAFVEVVGNWSHRRAKETFNKVMRRASEIECRDLRDQEQRVLRAQDQFRKAQDNLDATARELERKHEQSEPVGPLVDPAIWPQAMADIERAKPLDESAFVDVPDVDAPSSDPAAPRPTDGADALAYGILGVDMGRPYPPPSEQAGISDEVVQRAMEAFRVALNGHGLIMAPAYMRAALQSAFPRGVGSGHPACPTCEGTGLANVADYDGALVIDDCPECGGESRTAHPAPEAQAEGEPVAEFEMELRHGERYGRAYPTNYGLQLGLPIGVYPCYLRPQPSASETPSAVDVSLLAYEAGWMACAEWVERDDLPADTGSYAYCCERDSRLAAIAAQTGVCAHCGRPAGGHTLACSSIRAEAIAAQRKEGESKKHDGPCWRNSHSDCGC